MKGTNMKAVHKPLIALLCTIVVAASGTLIGTTKHADAATTTGAVPMYRLYNKWNQEHFYTANANERQQLIKIGWSDENIGWYAPTTGDEVYRLFNPYSGDHHYTLSKTERDTCVKAGWRYEGVGWYSDTNKEVPLYRQYNPWATTGSHNYTTSLNEHRHLVSIGWRDESIAWYGVNTQSTPTPTPTSTNPSTGNTSNTGGNANTGNSGNTGTTIVPACDHNWIYRYVVDRPASTETIHHYAEGYWTPNEEVEVCSGCGFTAPTSAELWAHIESQLDKGIMTCQSFYNKLTPSQFVETKPAWDETVTHAEEGHNEWYCTKCGRVA